MKPLSLDNWREFFKTAQTDIFEVIEFAIMIAAADYPKEFKLRRDRVVERLFTALLTVCPGCNLVESAVSLSVQGGGDDDNNTTDDYVVVGVNDLCEEGGVSKESDTNSFKRDDDDVDDGEVNKNDHEHVSNSSYGEAEALSDEIEEATQMVDEVLRLKDILTNYKEETESMLLESLRKLQSMSFTIDTLKDTEIGKAVNVLRKKHFPDGIRNLAQTLINCWKKIVDEYYIAEAKAKAEAEAVDKGNEGATESVNPSVVDEEKALLSPPLDKEAQRGPIEANAPIVDKRSQLLRQEETCPKPRLAKPLNVGSGAAKPSSPGLNQMTKPKSRPQEKLNSEANQRKPLTADQNKLKCSDETDAQKKLEATKRKLQERYLEVANAKRQRTVQVMELKDLPKEGERRLETHNRQHAHNRQRAQSRR